MSTPQPTYTISNLQHTTQYYVWIQAEDGIGNLSAPYRLDPATTVTADGTDPVVSGFDVNQSATGYAFSPSAGTVSDNKAGPLKIYLIVADTAMTVAQLALTLPSVQASAKNENAAYANAGASLDVATLNLSANEFWNGTAFQAISEATPVSGSLVAHLLVLDANNNDGTAATAAKTVADRTAPQFSGSVALAGVGSDSVKVTWSTGFTDGRGLNSGLIYYSTSDPSAAANLTAWKTAATSANVAAADLGAAGNQTVPSLAAGTYYAYLSVADAAGNTLDVRPSPASVDLGNQTAPPLPAVGGNFTSPTAPPGMGTPNDKGVYTVNTEIEKSISLTGYTPICTYVFVIKSGGTMSSYSLGAQSFVGIERRSGSGQVGQRMMYQDFHRYVPSGQTQQTQASLFTPSVTTNNAITDTYIGDSTRYRAIIFRQDFSGANKICRIDVVNSTGLVTSKETSQAVKTEGIYHNIIVYSAPTTMLLYGYVRRLGQYISDADALAYGRYLAYQADNA